jgi:hypothetical protein
MFLRRLRFYTDDSYIPCGKRLVHTVVAGIAISADLANIKSQLLEAESRSKKYLSDWYHTRPVSTRERYLDAVLDISALRGRIFYRAFDTVAPNEKWGARVDTLESAINAFTPGDCHHAMFPEGLMGNPRHQLRMDLRRRGCDRVTVESAQFSAEPEVRLSDAIAGYVRGELYRGDGGRAILTNIPDWFLDLDATNTKPPGSSGG